MNDNPNCVSDPPYKLRERHELVARLHHRGEHQELRGVARGGGDRGAAAFQVGDAFLQHRTVGLVSRV